MDDPANTEKRAHHRHGPVLYLSCDPEGRSHSGSGYAAPHSPSDIRVRAYEHGAAHQGAFEFKE
jgi:hypothetical protein